MNMNRFTMSVTQNFKRLGVFTLLSIGALTIQSCSKDVGPAPEYAFLNITNSYPTPATFNIFIDQNKINSSGAVAFGGNSGYLTVPVGNHNIKFTTASNTQALIEQNISFEANSIRSVFLIENEAKMEYLILKDEIGDMTSSKAFVRFINLSPNAPALDLAVKDGDVIISDKAFKTYSNFIEIEAKSYLFELKDKETGTTLEGGELESFEFKAGKSYTIVAGGIVGPSDVQKPFTGTIYTNQ